MAQRDGVGEEPGGRTVEVEEEEEESEGKAGVSSR